ncbi:MAG: hypothetical protein NZ805_08120 [Armatimonadetes bacterium]|nr:hypothetical protein [Armatimonadota bacterium]MDW8029193.1 hypothetical protein [Armatimonadota bacterium]
MPKSEPSLVGALVLLVMMAGGFTGLMWEIFAFVRKRTILSPSRFAWRIATWVIIIAVFFGMFAGLYLFRFNDPRVAIRYWSFFLAFAFFAVVFLVVMAYRDWKWLMSEQFRRKVELYHQLGEDLKKLSQEKRQPEGDGREQ